LFLFFALLILLVIKPIINIFLYLWGGVWYNEFWVMMMIERYQTEAMKQIWTDSHKYATWWQVELAVLAAYVQKGLIPQSDYEQIKLHARNQIGE